MNLETNKSNKRINQALGLDKQGSGSKKLRPLIRPLVYNALDIIAPQWSLHNFIAVNPLQGFEDLVFDRAVEKAALYFSANGYPHLSQSKKAFKQGKIDLKFLRDAYLKNFSYSSPILHFAKKEIDMLEFFWSLLTKQDSENFANDRLTKLAKSYQQGFKLDQEKQVQMSLISEIVPNQELTLLVNAVFIKWLLVYYDEGQAYIAMPDKDRGFYQSWKDLAIYDDQLASQELIKSLPNDPKDAISFVLEELEIDSTHYEEYLRLSFAALPGWSGFIKWKLDYKSEAAQSHADRDSAIDYIAVRLCIELALLKSKKYKKFFDKYLTDKEGFCEQQDQSYKLQLTDYEALIRILIDPASDLQISLGELYQVDDKELQNLLETYSAFKKLEQKIWLEAWEASYRASLMAKLDQSIKNINQLESSLQSTSSRKKAQLVFCIDVRSEPFRRNLESVGEYETFGFAGFFALPIRFFDHQGQFVDSCPVLLKPKHEITELLPRQYFQRDQDLAKLDEVFESIDRAFQKLKTNMPGAFVFAEAAGPLMALQMFVKTRLANFASSLRRFYKNKFSVAKQYKPSLDSHQILDDEGKSITLSGIGFKEQVLYAALALRMMGLTENFAPLVIFCGHGSTTVNNPYASALDCGACGGNHGGPNAKLLAEILNRVEVRKALAQEKIFIPSDTLFLGAEHDTTTDDLEIFGLDLITHTEDLINLQKDLSQVKQLNIIYRSQYFANSSDIRSQDWSEVRPEWGLARNAAFIVAPRSITQNIDLESRSFLHSYDYKDDRDGIFLETILTAPMVVAQWINSQYYFSSVDNVSFGSGSKITHNLSANIGVVQGNASDLMHGLPMQSLRSNDEELFHEPLRLSTFVYAPREMVSNIVAKHDILKKLFYNSWVKLVVIDPNDGQFYELSNKKIFEQI